MRPYPDTALTHESPRDMTAPLSGLSPTDESVNVGHALFPPHEETRFLSLDLEHSHEHSLQSPDDSHRPDFTRSFESPFETEAGSNDRLPFLQK